MICLKIRTFVVSATTRCNGKRKQKLLWFAWKFVPLWYQQQRDSNKVEATTGCDLLENSYLCGISNNIYISIRIDSVLWFAWKFVPLWYQQQPSNAGNISRTGCDLLENSYLCGISNNKEALPPRISLLWFAWKFVPLWYQQQRSNNIHEYLAVVICLKIRTFVVSATTGYQSLRIFY